MYYACICYPFCDPKSISLPSPPSTDRQVSGIEGNFRNTAENVMRVLRTNKESVTAMLEAFVHDPLINWRLLTTADAATGVAGAAAALGPAGAPITPGTVRDADGGGLGEKGGRQRRWAAMWGQSLSGVAWG